MSETVDRLNRIAWRAAANQALAEDSLWLAGVIDQVLAGAELHQALGRAPGWLKFDLKRRQQVAMLKAGELGGHDADGLRAAIRRYASGGWLRHRNRRSPPGDPTTTEYWLFVILQTGNVLSRASNAGKVISSSNRQLERIVK